MSSEEWVGRVICFLHCFFPRPRTFATDTQKPLNEPVKRQPLWLGKALARMNDCGGGWSATTTDQGGELTCP